MENTVSVHSSTVSSVGTWSNCLTICNLTIEVLPSFTQANSWQWRKKHLSCRSAKLDKKTFIRGFWCKFYFPQFAAEMETRLFISMVSSKKSIWAESSNKGKVPQIWNLRFVQTEVVWLSVLNSVNMVKIDNGEQGDHCERGEPGEHG